MVAPAEVISGLEDICGEAMDTACFQATVDEEADEDNLRGPLSRFVFFLVRYFRNLTAWCPGRRSWTQFRLQRIGENHRR